MGAPKRRRVKHASSRPSWFTRAILSIFAVATTTLIVSSSEDADAKTPGATYCFYGTCHRVKTLTETEALVGTDMTLSASFYDDCRRDRLNPCGLTSSGERFDSSSPNNAASPIFPDGTKLLVWSPENGQAAEIRVNNAGPYWGGRKLDVSSAAARLLGFAHRGVARLKVRVLEAPTKAEATYSKNRHYQPVKGSIGSYAGMEMAAAGFSALSGLEMVASSMLAPVASNAQIVADGSMKLPPRLDVAALEKELVPDLDGMGEVATVQTASLKSNSSAEFVRLLDTLDDLALPAAKAAVVADAGDVTTASPAQAEEEKTVSDTPRAKPRQRSAEARARAKASSAGAVRVADAGPFSTPASLRRTPSSSTRTGYQPSSLTSDGPHDMSMFGRHDHVEMVASAAVPRAKFAQKRAQLKGGRPAA